MVIAAGPPNTKRTTPMRVSTDKKAPTPKLRDTINLDSPETPNSGSSSLCHSSVEVHTPTVLLLLLHHFPHQPDPRLRWILLASPILVFPPRKAWPRCTAFKGRHKNALKLVHPHHYMKQTLQLYTILKTCRPTLPHPNMQASRLSPRSMDPLEDRPSRGWPPNPVQSARTQCFPPHSQDDLVTSVR